MNEESKVPRYNDLKAIPGHKNYYRNPVSQKITYKRRGVRIATGVTQITRAKEAVELELAKIHGRVESSAKKRIRGVSNPVLCDVWSVMLDERRVDTKASTIQTYNKNWRVALEPFWGEKFAHDVSSETLLEYKHWYLKTHPTRYFKKTFIHLQVLLKYMLKQKFINELPDLEPLAIIDDLTNKASKRVRAGRVFTSEELSGMWTAAEEYDETDSRGVTAEHKEVLALRVHLGYALGAKCGMRKMEGLSLEWAEHIDFEDSKLKVWSQKNHKWREVPLVPDVKTLFRRQYKISGRGRWVFPMPSDPTRHISSQIFDKLWIKVKRNAGIKGRARYHDLRHTFATLTAENDWNPVTACAVLDMNLETYQKIYCKPSFEKKAELMLRTFGGAP